MPCKTFYKYTLLTTVLLMALLQRGTANTDTLRVMAYNVLGYGEYPLCQGPNSTYHAYLQTIVQYANPDIVGLEKMGSIKTSPTDNNYSAELDFQDSILKYVFDPLFPGRFSYCPFTNFAASATECLVFFNQDKLGLVGRTCTYSSTEDFNTFKLYYKDPNLATTHDTTFLYVTDNHDISGSGNSAQRGTQIAGEMADIALHFSHLPNMINMGDFNLTGSLEPVYQTLTAPADTNFRFDDPPFYPDANLTYPANWDNNPASFTKYLTTSTRQYGNMPNSCGTSGGAKSWYDHIFLSPWIVNDLNYVKYIPNSYHAIGNDGQRLGISVNANTNTSVPANVADALFQMSNKYPVMVALEVSPNVTGTSLPDPELHPAAISTPVVGVIPVLYPNPANDVVYINSFNENNKTIVVYNITGQQILKTQSNDRITCIATGMFTPGMYYVRVQNENGEAFTMKFNKN